MDQSTSGILDLPKEPIPSSISNISGGIIDKSKQRCRAYDSWYRDSMMINGSCELQSRRLVAPLVSQRPSKLDPADATN